MREREPLCWPVPISARSWASICLAWRIEALVWPGTCWLTYRLHVLQSPKPITWKALQSQFGNGYRGLHHFKPRFLENLHLACAVYPGADIEVDERGLTLKPSRPPVAPRLVAPTGRT